MKILAVIPARGGSKGIPRKNVRLMNGKPLIAYSVLNAQKCDMIDDVVVTTDDEEVISIANAYGVDVIRRDNRLACDNVTLDPVIYDAVVQMENRKLCKYDVVITLQATSPLLKSSTLNAAVNKFVEDEYDTYISVVNKAHLSWGRDENGYFPNYKERLNRQQLSPNYMETGAFFITKREFVVENSRLGKKISVYEVPENEAVDIDSANDWMICEHELSRKKIVFRADGYRELGMGHIFHCLTLAYHLTGHDCMFVTNRKHEEGYNRLKESFMPLHAIETEEQFYDFLEEYKPDVVVNDCLNTTKEHILKLKRLADKVITIEDLGEGAEYADAVINALYNIPNPGQNQYIGADYVCLRDEFLIKSPKEFSDEVQNVLVMFGGTDPSGLMKKIYDIAKAFHVIYPDIRFTFITGVSSDAAQKGIVDDENDNIFVYNNVKNVSDYMKDADLAFTSQGRTVYELASMGVPAIVLAQNEREQLHTFAQMNNGFLNLGIGRNVDVETIKSTFKWLVDTPKIRKEMRELMLKNDLGKSIDRVIDIILK